MACTLLSGLWVQALSTRWAFQDPGRDQGSSRGDQGVRGAWAGLEGSWPGPRLVGQPAGEGSRGSQWPWAVSKRRVSPVIRTLPKVDGGALGHGQGLRMTSGGATLLLPWSLVTAPSHSVPGLRPSPGTAPRP